MSTGPSTTAVLLHVGTPCAAIPYELGVGADVAARGLRLVTYSRRGYASSTRREGRFGRRTAPETPPAT